jgi:hypothetical protein
MGMVPKNRVSRCKITAAHSIFALLPLQAGEGAILGSVQSKFLLKIKIGVIVFFCFYSLFSDFLISSDFFVSLDFALSSSVVLDPLRADPEGERLSVE